MLKVGDTAPDFEIKLHTRVRFRLSDQKGQRNVVLYFYPKDFTWGCTREGCLFANHIHEISRLNAIIIGINGDSLETHKRFAKEYNFPFPLGSDKGLDISRTYRVLWLRGIAVRRVTYIIDIAQIIRGVAHHELLIDRHWSYVVRTLKELHEQDDIRNYNRQAWNL